MFPTNELFVRYAALKTSGGFDGLATLDRDVLRALVEQQGRLIDAQRELLERHRAFGDEGGASEARYRMRLAQETVEQLTNLRIRLRLLREDVAGATTFA